MTGLSITISRISCFIVLAILPATAFSQAIGWTDLSGGYSCSLIVKTASGALFANDYLSSYGQKLIYSKEHFFSEN
jgi:hypothetical protein